MCTEIYTGSYDGCAADVWCCGVTLMYMVSGLLAVHEARESDWRFKRLLMGQYNYPPWSGLQNPIKDLLQRMLEPDPARRITLAEIMKHTWFVGSVPVSPSVETAMCALEDPYSTSSGCRSLPEMMQTSNAHGEQDGEQQVYRGVVQHTQHRKHTELLVKCGNDELCCRLQKLQSCCVKCKWTKHGTVNVSVAVEGEVVECALRLSVLSQGVLFSMRRLQVCNRAC